MFISMPRFQEGTPATFGYFMYQNSNSPIITPYPNWEMNRLGNCEGLTSVFRMRVSLFIELGNIVIKKILFDTLIVIYFDRLMSVEDSGF